MARRKTTTETRSTAPAALPPLRDEDLREVAGGRKAGKGQQEFLVVTMSDAKISAFSLGQ